MREIPNIKTPLRISRFLETPLQMTVTSPDDSNVPWQLIRLQCPMWCFTSVLQRQNPRLVQDSTVNNSRTDRDRTIKTVSGDSCICADWKTVEKLEGDTPWTPQIETARQAVVRARQEIEGGHFYFRDHERVRRNWSGRDTKWVAQTFILDDMTVIYCLEHAWLLAHHCQLAITDYYWLAGNC